ncbi:vesicular glutamate transporter 1 [Drosophila albomicans]|uniref:Vesicular glutamate transporter 1 n=1 Tax=Drosophila albomicans TaxID=7291 RepID=A0A6P8W904_DROAB|nr:vesicular glutamate transporter 1 [Drosophila albomicans]XP_034100142.1 vesicular glutamate transporter 1 [Drosophila albomicans]XP_051858985.1 vesicular glutamate transporter 1 [Drosophila albomicans]
MYSAPTKQPHPIKNRTSFRDKIPARLVLYFLSWSGFLVSFMMRNDMNIALVAMISNSNATESLNNEHTPKLNLGGASDDQISGIKSWIIGSFFWCYVLSQVVGGIATEALGTKSVFGWSQLATALCSLLMPLAAEVHYAVVIALRSIQGFASGLTWPAMYAIVGYWIPLAERSRFMSSFQGFSIGIGLTYPLCGFIITKFGWPPVFYTTGLLGVSWCLLWYALAFNTPREHPRITKEELNYIELNVGEEVLNSVTMKVPWRQIFLSLPVWAIGITTFGRIFVHYVFITSGPTFMDSILKFKVSTNGIVSGLPFLGSYVSAVLFCYIADKLLLHKIMTLTNVRKVFTALSQVVPGLLIAALGYIDNIGVLLTFWFIAVMLITASYAGAMANIIDLAPNYGHSGAVLAFCQTIHMSASFISPLTVGYIVTDEKSISQWRIIFVISGIIAVVTYIFYQFFATAEIQPWNALRPINNQEDEEAKMVPSEKAEKKYIPKST